jgi:hypothetical protein
MSGYAIRAKPITVNGERFDSRLEWGWVQAVRRIGLDCKREPFAIIRGGGRVTSLNVVSRPDFFLDELGVILECKPTLDHVLDNEDRWWEESEITGLPVAVTESAARPELMRFFEWGYQMPPCLWTFYRGERFQTYFAACPDCTVTGLLLIPSTCIPILTDAVAGYESAYHMLVVDRWLSACNHRPSWTSEVVANAIRDERFWGRLLEVPENALPRWPFG